MASTAQNRHAGRLLRDMRKASGLRQSDFAEALTDRLGTPVQQSTISSWESGTRTVPGAVLLAAQAVSGASLDQLLGSQGPAAETVYHDATKQLADMVENMARMFASEGTRQAHTAESRDAVLARAQKVRKLLEGTDTPDH